MADAKDKKEINKAIDDAKRNERIKAFELAAQRRAAAQQTQRPASTQQSALATTQPSISAYDTPANAMASEMKKGGKVKMAKKKVKRYDEGGDVESGGLREVSKSRFDEDTNARAKSFTDSGYRAEAMPVENEPAPKARSLTSSSPAPKKAAPDYSDQNSRNAAPEKKTPDYSDQNSRNIAPKNKTFETPARMGDDRNGPIGDTKDAIKEKYESMKAMGKFKPRQKASSTGESGKLKYAKGGMVTRRGDGIAQRGRTKGTVR